MSQFYDAKYIDTRDNKVKSGKELFNGRINCNHKRDTENLHKYRGKKVSKGRVSTRKQHYSIQAGDTVLYNGKQHICRGLSTYGKYAVLDKPVNIKKVKLLKYASGWRSA